MTSVEEREENSLLAMPRGRTSEYSRPTWRIASRILNALQALGLESSETDLHRARNDLPGVVQRRRAMQSLMRVVAVVPARDDRNRRRSLRVMTS